MAKNLVSLRARALADLAHARAEVARLEAFIATLDDYTEEHTHQSAVHAPEVAAKGLGLSSNGSQPAPSQPAPVYEPGTMRAFAAEHGDMQTRALTAEITRLAALWRRETGHKANAASMRDAFIRVRQERREGVSISQNRQPVRYRSNSFRGFVAEHADLTATNNDH